jgi:putative exosortase-associated protein (TIGR04073 family)
MKKLIVVLVVMALIFGVSGTAFADDMLKKLGRGVANIITCPYEIVRSVGSTSKESGVVAGLTWGMLKGAVDTVKRGAVGVFETVTFPVPVPSDYQPILTDPEFVFEDELAVFKGPTN